MKKESFITNVEKATCRSVELSRCRKAHEQQAKIKGHYVYVPETKTEVFVRKGRNEDMVINRHIKYFNLQRYNPNFGRVIID